MKALQENQVFVQWSINVTKADCTFCILCVNVYWELLSYLILLKSKI